MDTLDCGHAPGKGDPYNGGGMGWQFVLDDKTGRKICHACADARILECGHTPSPHEIFTTGYGVDPATGARSCYACCADKERAGMIETGRAVLYLVDSQASTGRAFSVQNWPGSLSFPAYGVSRKPRGGGFGAQRTDAYFRGPDGCEWHAVNRGDNQIARCKRAKARV